RARNVGQPYAPCESDISPWSRQRTKTTFDCRHIRQIQIHRGQLDIPGRRRRNDTSVTIPPPPSTDGFSPHDALRSNFQAVSRTTGGYPPHHLPLLPSPSQTY